MQDKSVEGTKGHEEPPTLLQYRNNARKLGRWTSRTNQLNQPQGHEEPPTRQELSTNVRKMRYWDQGPDKTNQIF